MDLLLFGDQTTDYLPTLQTLLRDERGSILSKFLRNVNSLLQFEINALSNAERSKFPSFSDIDELASRYEYSDQNALVDSVLVCLTQLVHYIQLFETPRRENYHSTTFRAIGACTGLLAASAVASCDNLTKFVPLAVETVRISFRVGLLVASRAKEISTQPTDTSWSTIISSVSVEDAKTKIGELIESRAIESARLPYISSIGPSTITISGPPNTMRLIFDQQRVFGKQRSHKISVRGPYHAPHIYSIADLATVIPAKSAEVLELYSIHPSRIIGMDNLESTKTIDLFHHAINQMLRECLIWETVLDSCTKFASNLDIRPVSMGSSFHSNGMASLLRHQLPRSRVPENSPKGNTGTNDLCNESKIAIVGMAGRFPNAASHEELWALIEKGFDTHRTVPPDRWDFRTHTDTSGKGKNKNHTPYGCFLDNPAIFDNRFFNMSPREASQTDPVQRLALVTAYEAMESSGMILNRTPSTQSDRVATFYGQASDDWREVNSAQDIDTFFITGGIRAFGPGRINYHFGFQGPSYNVDTACSSSLAAIQLACTSLKSKECDTVVAGGLNIYTNPDIYAGLSKGQFLSKTGPCKTFDDEADGYCRGEGIGTVILKRLSDALVDRDPVLGVIIASATNHSAEAVSITHPHIETQEALFRKVLREGRSTPVDVSYVEMHGTGTQAGDSVETESVTRVFAPAGRHRRKANNPLFFGSVKANVGHGEAASGVTGLVKVLSMLHKNLIPPHCGIKTPINQGFPTDMAERNVHIPKQHVAWERQNGQKRQILLNNFGAAGGNTALLLEDAPLRSVTEKDPRPRHLVTVSAKTASSFRANVKRLLDWTEEKPSINIPSLSYTTTARRYHYKYRAVVDASSQSELCSRLREVLDVVPIPALDPPNIVLVFTGQGCQYRGMGQSLMSTSKSFRDHINNLDRISITQGFPSFKGFIDSVPTEAPKIQHSPIVAQMALVCLEIALARLWISWGVLPSAVIGHSLGEFAALNIAGVLSDYDTIYLVGTRAHLMQIHCQPGTHSMLAVRGTLDKNDLEMCLQNDVEVACSNSLRDIVLSGPTSQIEKVQMTLSSSAKTQNLKLPFAFHSSQVDPVLDSFESSSASVVFSPPKISVISALFGKTVSENDEHHPFSPSYVRRHCREAVDFVGALQSHIGTTTQSDQAKTMWLEVGPHPACSSMIKGALGNGTTVLASLSKSQDPYATLVAGLTTLYSAGRDINWGEYHRHFESFLAVLQLPTYSFEEKRFWIDYKNDWTLTKGEEKSANASVVPSSPSTTTVHKIISQGVSGSKATIVAETSFSDPQLRVAVAGHLINGVGMCPSAIYADMALTLSQYSFKLLGRSIENVNLNVRDMANSSPLIVDLATDANLQVVELKAESDLSKRSTNITIRSKNLDKIVEYTKCVVTLEDESDWDHWSRVEHLIKSRIETLTNSSNVSRIQEGMAYKLFSNLVQYGPKYRGMREVFLDSEGLEATARVSCRSTGEDGSFSISPYLIDNIAHISGFVMNANDSLDVNHVYISHGWESMRFKEPLSLGDTYQVYVKMLPQPGSKMVAGDVYVLHDSKIVGLVAQCRFQRVPQSLLNTLLPPRKTRGVAATVSSPVHRVTQEYVPSLHTTNASETFQAIPIIRKIEPLGSTTDRVISILAEEIGCDISELTDSTNFVDLGVDSLLSLSILGKLREEVDLEVDSTLFLEHTSVASLKRYLNDLFPAPKSLPSEAPISTPFGSHRSSASASTINSISDLDGIRSVMSSDDNSRSGSATVSRVNSHLELKSSASGSHFEVRSQSVLLQGSLKVATRNVFWLPDGSGSATSYALLPPLSRDICVWGLNCPFLTSPENFTIGVPAIVKIYLAEIKARQPNGPYILGGWSAGGILAYEATRQLLAEGESVETLLLIDPPFPLGLEALPSSFHSFCAKVGLLSSEENIPSWLLPHFAATVRELTKYSEELESASRPSYMMAKMPKTVVIWAVDGVVKGQDEILEWEGRMPNSMQWLVEDRSDLGPNGWEILVGDGNVTCLAVEGNHFTMMREPGIREVGKLVKKALQT